MSTAFSNVFIETDKQVATHLLFVYWFGLQNMRHHICSSAIKQHRDCFWVSTTLILQLAEETTDAKDAWKREPNGSQNVYIFIQNPPKTPYEVHFEKYFSKKLVTILSIVQIVGSVLAFAFQVIFYLCLILFSLF